MSCLFISLSPAVNLPPDRLRKTIAMYLKTNPKLMDGVRAKDIVQWTEGQNLRDYANKMARSYTWGGAIEIRAFCELFNMDVTIHVLYTKKRFTIESSKEPTHVVHISYTGNHFEPLYIKLY